VLQPGLKIQIPFLYKVTKDDMFVIAQDEVGLVESIDGQPLEPGRIFGRWVGGHDFITDVPTANDGDGRDSDPHDPGDWITSAEAASGPFAGCPVTNS